MASAAPAFPPTKETTNYARLCRLIVDVGSQVLRETFDRICPPATLFTHLSNPAVHATLQLLHKKRVLNPLEWSKLYPAVSSSVSSKNFDITLLMVLLRNICGLTPPVTGWDNLPMATDVTPEADIARIKLYRNTLYGHASQASVDDATFNNCWTDIRDTLVRLGGATYETAIDNLKDECIDPDIEEHYKELLKQWKVDEDSIKEKLDNMAEELGRKLDELKASVANLEGRPVLVKADPLDVEVCKAQLCSHYNTTFSQVRITPWDRDKTVDIDEVYTKLSWLKDVRTPSGTTKKELDSYTEIFQGHGRVTNPKRMLVYGRPGIGKSTFSQKLAIDWANDKNETMKKFDLLLLVKLRDVGGIQDLPAILAASKLLAADGPISTDSLYDYVRHNQDKVLLVLDGFDEYTGGQTSPIREIWEGSQLRDCHVIMTTRPMEGEELIKFSHVQCEIRGFVSKEQVNLFASRFIKDQKEIEEFNNYLSKGKLWDLAEIPLLLLMLCLIWKNRHHKELPTSKLGLHERFVETLLFHMDIKDSNDGPGQIKENISILDDYKVELDEIGRLALEALLQNTLYIDLKSVKVQSDSLTDKMIRSGLFQFSKLAIADPNKTIFFLHKSIQEFLAARYIMNEAGMEEGKKACFARIDSFSKVLQLRYFLKFMCEWSEKGARAVFSLLRFIGEKEDLTECCLSKTPSLSDLSFHQLRFRDVSLECLLSCSTTLRQDLYPTFLSCVSGVVSIGYITTRMLATEHLPKSDSAPSYIFFDEMRFPNSVIADLNACVVSPFGHRLDASKFIQMYCQSSEARQFFMMKEGDQFYLYFSDIFWKNPAEYIKIFRTLAPLAEPPSQKQHVGNLSSDLEKSVHVRVCSGDYLENTRNCLSVVSRFIIGFEKKMRFSEELVVLSAFLSLVPCPQEVIITQPLAGIQNRLFDAQLLTKVVSNINFNDNLCCLILNDLNMSAADTAIIASCLHQSPNLHKLDLSNNCLYEGVRDLAAKLCHVPLLSVLRLSGVGMGDLECGLLATSLPYLTKLTSLDLSFNSLGEGIIALTLYLKGLLYLERLNLERTNMDEKKAAALAEALKSGGPKLQFILLGGNPLRQGVRVLVQVLSASPDLKELNLRDVNMTKNEIDAVSAAGRGIVKTSYHFDNGDRKPESRWPKISPIPESEFRPMGV